MSEEEGSGGSTWPWVARNWEGLAFNAAVLAWPEGSGRTWLKVLM